MVGNVDGESLESVYDIIDYLRFAGHDVTRDQLTRHHRRGLLGKPLLELDGARSANSLYPIGTAERMLRIVQLRASTKQLDELAWRLWWEGYGVELDLVRHFLVRRAGRWDDQLHETRVGAAPSGPASDATPERDVLEEVFFQHLRPGPSLVSARRRLVRDSDLYAELSALVIDLLSGHLTGAPAPSRGLFGASPDAPDSSERREGTAGSAALTTMRGVAEIPYSQLVEALDDKELASARQVAVHFVDVIVRIGRVMQNAFGGAGRGRDNVGASLVSLSESPEEQALALVLTSSFLHDDQVRDLLSHIESTAVERPPVEFRDFLRLRFLAGRVPGVAELIGVSGVGALFESPERAREWREHFERLLLEHALEIEASVILASDLFEELDAGGSVPDDASDERTRPEKKKSKMRPWAGECSYWFASDRR